MHGDILVTHQRDIGHRPERWRAAFSSRAVFIRAVFIRRHTMRVRIGLLFVLLLGVTALLASTLNQYGVADQRQVTFSQQVKVGDSLVPAGDYKVLHLMEGEEHAMLFKQLDVPAKKAVVVKVKCTLKPLPEIARTNEQRYQLEDGVQVLIMLQFKGDKAQHIF